MHILYSRGTFNINFLRTEETRLDLTRIYGWKIVALQTYCVAVLCLRIDAYYDFSMHACMCNVYIYRVLFFNCEFRVSVHSTEINYHVHSAQLKVLWNRNTTQHNWATAFSWPQCVFVYLCIWIVYIWLANIFNTFVEQDHRIVHSNRKVLK